MRTPTRFLAFTFLLLQAVQLTAETQLDPLFNRQIEIPGEASPELRKSAELLEYWLEKVTTQDFSVLETDTRAASGNDTIRLERAADLDGAAHASVLEKLGKKQESFVIESLSDKPGVRIIGRSDLAIRRAVFFYLEQLGCRWLLPNERWNIIPKRDNLRLNLQFAKSPAFISRDFFGTGGFGGTLPLDPERKLVDRWETWKEANLMGTSVRLGGHYGETFIIKNKQIFEEHPEYRAELNGARVPMSTQFQFCYSNPDLRKLYIEDRLADLRKRVETKPEDPSSQSISVEPADGAGHCECAECTKMGSVTDRLIQIADEVGARVTAEFPGRYVNLYAYNMHVEPPTFKAKENVIVSVVPYAFVYSGSLMGNDLVKAWGQKVSALGLYDYWGMTDWSKCTPNIDYLKAIPAKIRFWHHNNVELFNAESSTGAGATGIAWYVAARLLWDPNADENAVSAEFYDLAFGPARAPMQRMLERWAGGYLSTCNDVGLAYRDLKEARDLAKDSPEITARINDYISYVHYLRLLLEHDAEKRGSEERIAKADELIAYLWRIYDSAMVQTFRITQLNFKSWNDDPSIHEKWDWKNPDAPGWATVQPPLTDAEMVALLEDGLQKYPIYYETRQFSSDLVPIEAMAPLEQQVDGNDTYESVSFFGPHTFAFSPKANGTVTIALKVPAPAKVVAMPFVTVLDEKGETILHDVFEPNGEWKSYEIPAIAGHTYRMQVNDRKMGCGVRLSRELPFVVENNISTGNTNLKVWFYVPKGTKRFAVMIPNNPIPDKLTAASPQNERIEPILLQGEYAVFEVEPEEEGTIWSLLHFKTYAGMKLLNVPSLFSLRPEAMMTAKEAAPHHPPKK